MSFLDMVSCGFGAIILLLVLALALEPATREHIAADLSETIEQLQQDRQDLVADSQQLTHDVTAQRKTLQSAQDALDALNEELSEVQRKSSAASAQAEKQARMESELQAVLQTLTEEMKRMLANPRYQPRDENSAIGGIPVDSEYVIFVIDTSGSMLLKAWPTVVSKMQEVLSVYPALKGLQVMNDMGLYMFQEYAGKWIPDTPARRKEVLRRFRTWRSFSNSSPVEGISTAIRRYAMKDDKISLYVFGDDFSSGSIDKVAHEVWRINRNSVSGKPRVRIHAFGFPVLYSVKAPQENIDRFAHLMRVLAEQNAGSFVGLSKLD